MKNVALAAGWNKKKKFLKMYLISVNVYFHIKQPFLNYNNPGMKCAI